MSTLGLPIPPQGTTIVPQRTKDQIPTYLEAYMGRLGCNVHRLLDRERTVPELARMLNTSEKKVRQALLKLEEAQCVRFKRPSVHT